MNPEFFAKNRQSILAASACDVLVFAANRSVQRSGDSTFPFRQDSSFWYLTGLNEPDYVLVITKDQTYLIAPQRSEVEIIFDGQPDAQRLVQLSGIHHILSNTDGWEMLAGDLKKADRVGYLSQMSGHRAGFVLNDARSRLRRKLRQYTKPTVVFKMVNAELARLRMIKSEEELILMKQAILLTTGAFKKYLTRGKLPKYRYEFEVEAGFSHHFRKHNADHAYPPIVASGKNACTLHYTANNRPVQTEQLLLVDIGAEVSNYAADITRTVPVGKISKRHREVLKAVKSIQAFAINNLRPGLTIRASEQVVAEFSLEVLRRLKLIEKNDKEKLRTFMPHATSHFLGLDVHDVGDYRMPLEEGMVLTVEPGIYIPEEGIGVRIEDDVLITKNGHQNLSSDLPPLLG